MSEGKRSCDQIQNLRQNREYDYSKEEAGEALPDSGLISKGNTASENREKMAVLFGAVPPPKEEDFSFDPTAFSKDSNPKKKFSPEQEREAAEIDRVRIPVQ